jgi:hypothetical protein
MKITKILFGTVLSVAISSIAEAGNLTADCDGWTDDGTWDVPHPANVTATATLERFDAATGTWVTVETSVDTVSLAPNSPLLTGGTWSGPLDGSYRVSLVWSAEVIYSEVSKETWNFFGEYGPFDCAPPPPANERRTPGYWKNHPESWPVTSLTIGDQSYSQACLLDVLDLPTRGDTRIKLIHHLIAAKLNLLPNAIPGIGGTDPSIQPTVDAADQFLIDSGTTIDCSEPELTGDAPRGALRDQSNDLKDDLDAYNNNVDIGSSGSPLAAAEEGGCTAMSAESHLEVFALPLLALFFARRRINRRAR